MFRLLSLVLIVLFIAWSFSLVSRDRGYAPVAVEETPILPLTGDEDPSSAVNLPESENESLVESPKEKNDLTNIHYPVPFVSQAPTGEWGKSEFQNGCEEAATLMVSLWRTGKNLTSTEARSELIALARYQERKIDQAIDTDAATTAQVLLDEYFGIRDYSVRYDFDPRGLIEALSEGIVIVPTNGRALGNPNFTSPGPLQHMVVIIGYDAEKNEFITHDPGTRRGASYRYPEAILYAAIREYPTGKHLPILGGRKAMIVVSQYLRD